MPGKHRNRNVPVFAPWDGVRRLVRYHVSEGKASELIESCRAIRVWAHVPENSGAAGAHKPKMKSFRIGIELVARARTDAAGIETGALAKKFSVKDTLGFTQNYIRSRSPSYWRSGHRSKEKVK